MVEDSRFGRESPGARVLFPNLHVSYRDVPRILLPHNPTANGCTSRRGGNLKPINPACLRYRPRRGVLPRRGYFGESRGTWMDR